LNEFKLLSENFAILGRDRGQSSFEVDFLFRGTEDVRVLS